MRSSILIPRSRQKKAVRAGLLIATVIAALVTTMNSAGVFQRIEWMSYDWRMEVARKDTTAPDDIAVILIDECQNMSFHELDSIITRIGQECRVIFCGDFRQADLAKNGLKDFVRILKAMNEFDFIDFDIKDIVRSEFVKQYITVKIAMRA